MYSQIYEETISESPWGQSKKAWELLNDKEINDDTNARTLEVKGWKISVIDGFLNKDIWESLPLLEHRVLPFDKKFEDYLLKALKHLLDFHEALIHDKKEFLKTVCFLDLEDHRKKDSTCITSVTVPNFPFTSFFSNKAGIHVPPCT
jgi:hypothetical protein